MKRYFAVFIATYTVILLYMMFYASGREPSGISYIQIQPFITIDRFFNSDVSTHAFAVNIIGNVFLFSPFGWLGLCISRYNRFFPLTLFFLIAISIIESVQYATGRGVADIDDILLNTLGMLIGFSFYKYITIKNIANICDHFEIINKRKIASTTI